MIFPNRSNSHITCIIPFYNEGTRVIRVLDALIQSRVISQIICVDDGSTDDTYKKIHANYPNIEVIRSDNNQGKSRAIGTGLASAREDNILLFDADLEEINLAQLDAAIIAFLSSPWIDMIILRRMNDLSLCRFLRVDVVLSGERLVRKCDLQQALELNPLGYQLELAINEYMDTNDRSVCWMPLSSRHMIKIEKAGLVHGLVKEIKQHSALIHFKGAGWYHRNLATFCLWEFGYERNFIHAIARLA